MTTKTSSDQENALVQELGDAFDEHLVDLGKALVREVVATANKEGIGPKLLPYTFWVLFEDYENWPNKVRPNHDFLRTMLRITSETGSMPRYYAALKIPEDRISEVNEAVDRVVLHMGAWSRQAFIGLIKTWMGLLQRIGRKVPKATEGQVPASASMSWLHKAFREMLSMRQSWFKHAFLLLELIQMFPSPR